MATVELDSLIADALIQIGIPPALRERAKRNMLNLVQEQGLHALEVKVDAAKAARAKASGWLESRAAVATEGGVGSSVQHEYSFWRAIRRHVERHRNRHWAEEFYSASSSIRRRDAVDILNNRIAGVIVCDQLEKALEREDFSKEHPVLRAGILTEVANIFAIFAKIHSDLDRMTHSIAFYKDAVEAVRRSNFPQILPIIQMNRAHAIVSYSELVHREFIEKFRADVVDVVAQTEFNDPTLGAVLDPQDTSELQAAIVSVAEFYFGHSAPVRERVFKRAPIDKMPPEYAEYFFDA